MRRAATPAIPPKMYRHFALVTVLLTAVVAMFASGENRKAVTTHIEQQTEENELRRESYARFGAPKIGGSPAPTVGSFADDVGEFGRPMDNPSGGLSSSVMARQERAEAAGYSPEYLASLSPAERELLLSGLEENGLLTEQARADRGAALAAASSRRSGTPTSGD
jgi:hypothetical protein